MGLCKSCYITQWLRNSLEGRKKSLKYKKKYRENNRKKLKLDRKIYYQKNKEAENKRVTLWRKLNEDRWREYSRGYGREHDRREYIRAWKKTLKGKIAQAKSNFLRRTGDSFYSDKEIKRVLENNLEKYLFYTCESCRKITLNDYHIDHIIPISKNGGNQYDNFQVLCPKCNFSKNDRVIDYRVTAYLEAH